MQTSSSTNASGDEPVYVISVAARLAGLPCWVLRVLDQEAIVVPVRTESNRRLYSDNDIVLLSRVRHLTEVRHVNIAGVKVILEMERAAAEQHERESVPVGAEEIRPLPASGNGQPQSGSPSSLPPYSVNSSQGNRS